MKNTWKRTAPGRSDVTCARPGCETVIETVLAGESRQWYVEQFRLYPSICNECHGEALRGTPLDRSVAVRQSLPHSS